MSDLSKNPPAVGTVSAEAKPPAGWGKLRRIVAASMAGTVVEWYEFFVYGTAVALGVFNVVFFPGETAKTGLIYGFSTYAIGFIARPLGGIVFGHFGDRIGRKTLLQLSILIVGVATFLMGCIPSYNSIGYAAAVILVVLRFIQGFAVGGEWGGAVLLISEHAPNDKRAFYGSFPQVGVPLGNFIATVVMLVLNAVLTQDQFYSWGWRVAFWLSAVIVLIGWWIRRSVEDAPIFKAAQQREEQLESNRIAFIDVFKHYPRQIIVSMLVRAGENVLYYTVVTFSITYLTGVGIPAVPILGFMLIAHGLEIFWIPLVASWADRIGRRPIYLIGALGMIGYAWVGFLLFDGSRNHGSYLWFTLGLVLGVFIHGLMYSVQPALMSEMFPTKIRYTAVSIGAQLTSVFSGSIAPLIGVALLGNVAAKGTPVDEITSANSTWGWVAVYIAAMGLVSVIGTLLYRETKGQDLAEVDAADPRLAKTANRVG
ncbi:MFS transporter [Nakamurella aerolata]|uniref:Putative proline/betaine transporter n=1 Tax=Nakamurella aerolata TaxID=1656892 RepID=A0A849A280_9ACTN|nr:MFS transporter [Nakamurella aerolata]NNG34719.1 MHS family MFS transporter [Nakamurella aerolata]